MVGRGRMWNDDQNDRTTSDRISGMQCLVRGDGKQLLEHFKIAKTYEKPPSGLLSLSSVIQSPADCADHFYGYNSSLPAKS
jgi:hypothetical protein